MPRTARPSMIRLDFLVLGPSSPIGAFSLAGNRFSRHTTWNGVLALNDGAAWLESFVAELSRPREPLLA